MVITLENEKKLVINAPANNERNMYVQQLQFNGKNREQNWLNHFEIKKGGTLNFIMGAAPNKQRGTKDDNAPYSFSKEIISSDSPKSPSAK